MLRKSKTPFIRDVYLSYLINGAKRTETDGFPIIERWMIAENPPKEIVQWDRRRDVVDPSNTGMSFYCVDCGFTPILSNPKAYVDKLRKYFVVISIDASPFDNMPLVVQKSQIFLNLAITYFFGKNGIKVIPNVRLGDDRTMSSLEAYPKHTLIAIGTNGFMKVNKNRKIFGKQVRKIVDILEPTGICVYGPANHEIFDYVKTKGIPIYQYDSYTMKENAKDKLKKSFGGKNNER